MNYEMRLIIHHSSFIIQHSALGASGCFFGGRMHLLAVLQGRYTYIPLEKCTEDIDSCEAAFLCYFAYSQV
jgi:hypothetical protein